MNMNGYYGQQYQSAEQPRPVGTNGAMQQSPVNRMAPIGMGSNNLDASMMFGGQTLDEIISQNNTEMMQRRQSIQTQYPSDRADQSNAMRRASMTEFVANPSGELSDFQFDPVVRHGVMGNGSGIMPGAQNGMDSRKRISRGNLASIDTRFSSTRTGYDQIASAPVYHTSVGPNNPLGYDVQAPYIPVSMGLSLDYMDTGMPQGTSGDVTPMNMYPQTFQNAIVQSPINQSFSPATRGPSQDPGGGGVNGDTMVEKMPNLGITDSTQVPRRRSSIAVPEAPVNAHMQNMNQSVPISRSDLSHGMDVTAPTIEDAGMYSSIRLKVNVLTIRAEDMPAEMAVSNVGPAPSQFPNAYSSSGFDMIRVLVCIMTTNVEVNGH
jgi:hypothetical protein